MCGMLSNNGGDMVEEGFFGFSPVDRCTLKSIYAAIVLSKVLKPHNCLMLRKNNFLKICICSGITLSEQL